MPESPEMIYTTRLRNAATLRDSAHRLWSLLGNIRLALAIIAIIGAWQQWTNPGVIWQLALVVGGVGFITLALQQRSVRVRRNVLDSAMAVNERALARFHHAWSELPAPPGSGVDRTHPYAYDLNIVGEASLARRIGTPATSHGWQALYASLLNDGDGRDISDRQAAITELAAKLDLRQNVEAVAREDIPDAAPLEAWSSGESVLRNRAWLRWGAIIGPIAVLLCAVIVGVGAAPWPILLIPITFNTIIFMTAGADAAAAVRSVGTMRDAAASYRDIMARISADSPTSPLLAELDGRLTGASTAMRLLARTVNFSIPAGSMLYFPLQMLTMWDVNVLHRLETWRGHHGTHLPAWLTAMGEWEALAALSVLSHDHPDWSLPEIDRTADGLAATALAHPLLLSDVAVANDVDISPRSTFLFVTGSNMSGKSTLLRAIGVNVVLAQAGAVVAASALRMPPLEVSCCMRVEDSLAQGVSFFMAELRRLKSVIDRVQQPGDRTALYMLDEILQGTNTAERQIASRYVLQQLTALPAIGAVSSHDLELIDDTALEQVAIPVHFAEQFSREHGEPEMTFDYLLRPGLATSSNAIRLMEMIGFKLPG